MGIVIKAIGLILIFMGITYVARPEIPRRILKFYSVGRRIYLAALPGVAIAVLLIIHAKNAHSPTLLLFLAVMFVFDSVTTIILGPKRAEQMASWYAAQPDKSFWVMGAVTLLIGSLVTYAS